MYAARLQGKRVGGAAARLTAEVTGAWLDELALRPVTRVTYEKYATYWLRHLRTLDDSGIAAYVRKRLREVRGKSVRSEVSALRSLLRWMIEAGELAEMPTVPKIPASSLGVPYAAARRRVAAPELTEREVTALLKLLPTKAPRGGFWVRDRCELIWETGLRPDTVDALSVPEHWAPKSKVLVITDDIDKEGFAREVPLTKRAIAILKRCAPKAGVIFGKHRYENFTRVVAEKALPAAKARVFTPQHLRSARATYLLERGVPLPAVQWLLGHKQTATTSRYIRPSARAAAEGLAMLG